MKIYKNEDLRKQIVSTGSEWVAQQQFTLFGTATYYDGTLVGKDEAIRDTKYFFNMLDRKLIKRKDYEEGKKLQRLAFIETGRTRTNSHIHFYIKGNDEAIDRQIKELSEKLWAEKITRGYNLIMKDNIGAGTKRNSYCWKEMNNLNADTLLVECCYIG